MLYNSITTVCPMASSVAAKIFDRLRFSHSVSLTACRNTRNIINQNNSYPSYCQNLSTKSTSAVVVTKIPDGITNNRIASSVDAITGAATGTVIPTLTATDVTTNTTEHATDSQRHPPPHFVNDISNSDVDGKNDSISKIDSTTAAVISTPTNIIELPSSKALANASDLTSTISNASEKTASSQPSIGTSVMEPTVEHQIPSGNLSSSSWRQTYIPTLSYIQYIVKREINLLQYYGITKYVLTHYNEFKETAKQQRQQHSNNAISTVNSKSIPNDNEPSPTTATDSITTAVVPDTVPTSNSLVGAKTITTPTKAATVPFVITMNMRYELMNTHGYTFDAIRQMTPLQANKILLQHQNQQQQVEKKQSQATELTDTSANDTPQHQQTIKEFHATDVKDSQTVQEFHHQNLRSENISAATNTAISTSTNTSSTTGSEANSTIQHPNLSTSTTTWYEILESSNMNTNATNDDETSTTTVHTENDNDDSNVIALYLNESDAQFALSIYEELAQRKHQEQLRKIHDNFQTNATKSSTKPFQANTFPTYTIRQVEKE